MKTVWAFIVEEKKWREKWRVEPQMPNDTWVQKDVKYMTKKSSGSGMIPTKCLHLSPVICNGRCSLIILLCEIAHLVQIWI